MTYTRFAVYYVPPEGPLAGFGASWLGWDIAAGREAPHYDLQGLRAITKSPRKYGFHATLKPPFRLKQGSTLHQLETAVATTAQALSPAVCGGLRLTRIGRLLALTPHGAAQGLQRVAEAFVRDLDPLRAPATEADLARRRKRSLSNRQDALLVQWGYPYVFEEFRFHMTLTGRLPEDRIDSWAQMAAHHLPDLPEPFIVDQVALCGEREDGHFEVLQRFALQGDSRPGR